MTTATPVSATLREPRLLGQTASTAAFDATDPARLERFFAELQTAHGLRAGGDGADAARVSRITAASTSRPALRCTAGQLSGN